jgi:hypothetical protein
MVRGQRYAEIVKATCVNRISGFFIAKLAEMWYSKPLDLLRVRSPMGNLQS